MAVADAGRAVTRQVKSVADEAGVRSPSRGRDLALRIGVPVLMLVLLVGAWQAFVAIGRIESFKLPSPVLSPESLGLCSERALASGSCPPSVLGALVENWSSLFGSLLVTLRLTLIALGLAIVGGVLLAVLMAQSKIAELAVYPYAVVLQVTPVIAIAPILLIWTPIETALLILAWIVAFFPILSNTTQGLKSTDHNLLNLFELYGASRWQTLIHLKLPNALPYFLAGVRIGGGLALIAAVVAEFAAGRAGQGSGLAFRLLEAGFRLKIPLQFAAVLLLSATGVLIFLATNFLSWLLLRRWHESAVRREN